MTVFAEIGRFLIRHILWIAVPFFLWNLFVMLLYVRDKKKAQKGAWRTPEATLIALAWAFGGLGAMFGMFVFRHKTKHIKFLIMVPLAFVVQWALISLSIFAGFFL